MGKREYTSLEMLLTFLSVEDVIRTSQSIEEVAEGFFTEETYEKGWW